MGTNVTGEQLEEGEIVDDDFEAISDNSIIEPSFGKFVSSNEHLRALSLSSDSESELIRQIKHKRKLLHRHRSRKRRKRRRVQTDSSDSDSSPPRDLKGKLKEAIHINGIETTHRNTLEDKLKAMGGLVISNEPEEAVEPPKIEEVKVIEENVDKIDDTELENLRIEALKTAVINKFQKRKRRKAAPEGQVEATPLETLENKENDTPKDEQTEKNHSDKVEVNNGVGDIEEDEDVLRASLLAGLAKKIAKKTTPSESIFQNKQIVPKLPVQIVSALPKRPVTNFKKNTVNKQLVNKNVIKKTTTQKINRPAPQVKPLIININDDSDTEDDIKQKETQPVVQKLLQTIPKNLHVITQKTTNNLVIQKNTIGPALPSKQTKTVQDINAIQNNVEKFLKEQRAKFETETQKKIQNLNKDKTLLEKSAVKLLPKSQQIEYQQLLKRLRNAEKRKKAKKLALQKVKIENNSKAQVTVDVGPKGPNVEIATTSNESAPPTIEVVVQPVLEKSPLPLENDSPTKEKTSSNEDANTDGEKIQMSKDSDTSEKKLKITSELTTLQKTLKDIKMQRNGSLQIKSQYQVLTPVIRKITDTSNERKKQEQRIKRLLQELNEARNSLANAHERFSDLVRELVSKKEQIDKSYQKRDNGSITEGVKSININDKIDNSVISKKDSKSVPVTSTPIKTQTQSDVMEEPSASTFVTSSTNHDCEDMDVCNSDETDICQIDIVDPNDIDQIFKRRPVIKSTIPEYVSPLNFNTYERYRNVDPLGIMCPYEVNGSCRDIDCTYKHYLKNHERL